MASKGIVIIILTIMLCGFTYKGTNVYARNINETECKETLEKIPTEYFKGVKLISITNLNTKYLHYSGFYFCFSNTIYLYSGCEKETLIHELAHYWQERKGINRCVIKDMHNESFYEEENEILYKCT